MNRPAHDPARRRRGVYVPAAEVELHLWLGWTVIDDCPGRDEALLAPPVQRRDAA